MKSKKGATVPRRLLTIIELDLAPCLSAYSQFLFGDLVLWSFACTYDKNVSIPKRFV